MKLQTPFYSKHLEHHCKWQEAPGFIWQAPALYSTLEEESKMVAERAGFIDYSLQYSLIIAGRDAFQLLQKVLVNDLRKIAPGKAIYSTIVNDAGTIIDDTVCFWFKKNLFCVVGIRKQQVYEWLKIHSEGMDVYIVDSGYALLAVQGPKSREILQEVVDVSALGYFAFMESTINEIPAMVARVGFTGELGYEIFVRPEYSHTLWDTILNIGKNYSIAPYGLNTGACLALEKGYLRLTDFYEGSSPLEVGLAWTVGFDKDTFIGKEALLKRRDEGIKTKLLGFEVQEPTKIASIKDTLICDGMTIGQVTRSAFGYRVQKSLGLAWVEIKYAKEGNDVYILHGNEKLRAKLVNRHWYDPKSLKIKA